MKQIIFFLLLFSQNYTLLFCQENKVFLYENKFSDEIEKELADGTLRTSSAAYHYTYIGNYQKALENYELHLDWGLDSISYQDSLDFLGYKVVPAKEYLSERIEQEQIVIISEAHQKPQHRIFTTELLEDFYNKGYRYLGIETITPNRTDSTKILMDILLHQRGYPLKSPVTGGYTREPQMGNLVRTALNLGFEIFAYERKVRGLDRDLQQAMNIEHFREKHPNGKILIHCGWNQAIESDYPKRKTDNWLAYHIKNRTGIEPLTIYQDALSEKTILPESPYYKMIESDEVSVLLNEKGDVFSGAEKEHFDILIYHPRTTYIRNRPSWLVDKAANTFVKIKKNKAKSAQYPIMVEAFLNGEKNAVPIDIIEIKNRKEKTRLLLPKGIYNIKITDRNREEFDYQIEVN